MGERYEFLRGKFSVIGKNLSARQYVLGLGLVVAAAGLVRFRLVDSKGLWYWDEGIFIMGARFIKWRIRFAFLQIQSLFNSSVVIPDIRNYEGYPVFLQKPVHVFMLALFSTLFKNDVSAATDYSIVFGLISIVATAELARRWFSPVTGLLAAAFLAFMPSHVHYSRLALHETDSMAVFLILLLSLQGFKKEPSQSTHIKLPAFTSGFLAVMVVGMSYRYLPYVCLALLMEISRSGCKKPAQAEIERWAWMLIGGGVCFLLLNIVYRQAFYPEFWWSEPSSYVSVLKTKFLGGESSFDLDHPLYYLKILLRFDGALPTALWLISLPMLFYRLNRHRLQCLAFILVPLALFSLTTTRVPRTITGIYPFIAMAWGWMLTKMGSFGNTELKRLLYRISTILIVPATLFPMLIRLPYLWSIKSGYQDVVKWLQTSGDERHFSTMYPVFAVYQGNQAVQPVPPDLETLREAVDQTGIRYLTVDWQKYLRYQSSVYEIERKVLPIAAFDHRPGDFLLSLYENHMPDDVPLLREDPGLRYIKVYDLYAALPEMGYPLFNEGSDHE